VDRGPERRFAVGQLVEVDQRQVGDTLLEHGNPRLDERLPLFRGVILGVLAEIAELPRAFDFLRQLRLELAIERDDLVLELSHQLIFHCSRRRPELRLGQHKKW
jgi:hypothetical protein